MKVNEFVCIGDSMETNEKTFRYSYVFKNLGVLYLIFLAVIVVISLFGGDTVFFICDGVMIGGGAIFVALYLTNSVMISESSITTKTILGTKSLKWSEIGHVSSRGSSLKLHSHNGDVVLMINPRLDGSEGILNSIFSKRADLFDMNKNNPLLRSFRSNVITLVIGLLLITLSLLLYAYKNYLYTSGFLGLLFCSQSLLSWYASPHSMALEGDRLVLNYLNRSLRFSVDDIESIQIGTTQQNQLKSVFIVFRDKRVMEVSGFKQTPFIIYPVLKQWHQNYVAKQPNPST